MKLVARLHNTCIYSVASHSWCQITPFTQSLLRHPEFLLPPNTDLAPLLEELTGHQHNSADPCLSRAQSCVARTNKTVVNSAFVLKGPAGPVTIW